MALLSHKNIFIISRLIVMILFVTISSRVSSQVIGTIAGTGAFNSQGDGNLATCADLMAPSGVCTDANGNIYIASQHSIRKINAVTGIITAYSGTSNPGSMNDGYPANSGLLHDPVAICMDADGNLYIAEKYWHRIRKINPSTGIITTVAGTGVAGFSGDGGPGTAAKLNSPEDIKTDNQGNLYVVDYENFRVRKINLSTGIITTIAGNGSQFHSGDGGLATNAGLALVRSVCADQGGNVYVSEARPGHSTRIRKINPFGTITTIAGSDQFTSTGDGGLAVNATIMSPAGLTTDFQGNIYFTDAEASRIRKININTGIINTIAGNGTAGFGGDDSAATSAKLMIPLGICFDNNGNILFADYGNNRIRKIYLNPSFPPPASPQVTISSPNVSTCNNQQMLFSATVINGSPNMTYQWYRNGNSVGTNDLHYSPPSPLNSGDVITCTVAVTKCNSTVILNSNSLTITGPVTPSVTIIASATTVCPGTTVQYNATAVNAGPNPTYRWIVNSVVVGSNSPVYTGVISTSGTTVLCGIIPDPAFACAGTQIVYSNQIGMTVTYGVAGTISITPSANDVCPGTPVTFTATTQFASSPSYQWQINGIATGSNQPVFTSATLSNQDAVRCILSGANACLPAPVISSPVIMQIKSVPAVVVSPLDTVVVKGTEVQLTAVINGAYSSYSWSPATKFANGASLTPRTIPMDVNTQFVLNVTTNDGCTVTGKSYVSVYSKLYMPGAFTPNDDGLNDIFRIPAGASIKLESFSVFDRWGRKVFNTKDVNEGWNGKLNGTRMPVGTYVYLIVAHDGDERIVLRGTCTLIR